MLELCRSGKLKLEELRTRSYSLDEVNIGYDDMRNGRNLRGSSPSDRRRGAGPVLQLQAG
jgi:hypothetical protein